MHGIKSYPKPLMQSFFWLCLYLQHTEPLEIITMSQKITSHPTESNHHSRTEAKTLSGEIITTLMGSAFGVLGVLIGENLGRLLKKGNQKNIKPSVIDL